MVRCIVVVLTAVLVMAAITALSIGTASAFPGGAAGKGVQKACAHAVITNNPFFTCP